MFVNALSNQILLQRGKYRIIKILGQGGFGITYLAEQCLLKKKVAIKEFFMHDLCTRSNNSTVSSVTQSDMVERYRQKFFKEAQIIARMEHPHIVRVTDIFEENGTAYYVMEYLEGESLADIIKKNGPLPEQTALRYISKVADALDYIHQQNVNHLDIKPANIMIRHKNDEPVLIDFGVSKQYDEQKSQTTTTPPGVSDGYSPLEQYKRGGVSTFSPQADIYALGATLYKLLTGNTPPVATDIVNNGLPPMPETVSANVRIAIEKAMQPRISERPQSVRELMAMMKDTSETVSSTTNTKEVDKTRILDAEEIVNEVPQERKGEKEEKKAITPKEKKYSYLRWVVLPVVVLLLAGLGWLFFQKSEETPIKEVNLVDKVLEASTGNEVIDNLIKNMVYVEGGSFTMGDPGKGGYTDKEKPSHQVTLSSYYIGRYEVTQEEWETVMGSNPSYFEGVHLPVACVRWDDCQVFIRRLNEITGLNFCLPTEAEWEFAARGGNKSKGYIYSGGNTMDDVGWYLENSGDQRVNEEEYNWDSDKYHCQPHTIGLKSPNELGLYDMSGNVFEWCSDWYGDYNSTSQIDPKGPTSGSGRVIRGGSYDCCSYDNYLIRRLEFLPEEFVAFIGFRLALSPINSQIRE